MKQRVGRVAEIKGETVKEVKELQDRCPGGKHMKSYKAQTWLEETSKGSSNHPAQDTQETLSLMMVELGSSTLLGSMLLRMAVSRGDEERSSFA